MNKKVALSVFGVLAFLSMTTAFGRPQSKPGFITIEGALLINIGREKKDSRGLGFWEVNNKGKRIVSISSDINKGVVVAPGEKVRVYRGKEFWMVFKTRISTPAGMKEYVETITTNNHYIDISTPYRAIRGAKAVSKGKVWKVESRE